MELNIKKEKINKLKNTIFKEYVYIILSILSFCFALPLLANHIIDDNTGIDGIGIILFAVFISRILTYIVTFIFFFVNPIRILIHHKNDFKEIESKKKKISYIFVISIPILISLLIIFSVPISNYMYYLKYETGKNSYSLTYDEYKTAKDFQKELDERGFIYNADFVLSRLNNKDEEYPKHYYEEATVMPLFTEVYYNHNTNKNKVITFDSNIKAPGYIYNTILYLYDKNEELVYAPVDLYSKMLYNDAFFKDYYIECKIFYIDDDIYAIIGVGQSYDIERYFDDNRKDNSTFYTYPYNIILSEKDNITTFVDGKYYSDGAIENEGDTFYMVPNTNERDWSEFYSVRKVDKVDVYTINQVAKELQNGILKDSIEYHFSK